MNKEQVKLVLQVLLATGSGPLYKLLAEYGLAPASINAWSELAIYILPGLFAGIWGIIDRRLNAQVSAMQNKPEAAKMAVANSMDDTNKIAVAETVPDVKAIVVQPTSTAVADAAVDQDRPKVMVS